MDLSLAETVIVTAKAAARVSMAAMATIPRAPTVQKLARQPGRRFSGTRSAAMVAATIPALGFGTFWMPRADVLRIVPHALNVGFRHIDTS